MPYKHFFSIYFRSKTSRITNNQKKKGLVSYCLYRIEHALPTFVWVFSGFSSFLPLSKNQWWTVTKYVICFSGICIVLKYFNFCSFCTCTLSFKAKLYFFLPFIITFCIMSITVHYSEVGETWIDSLSE